MKFPRGDPLTSATLLTFLLPFTTAASFDCSSISIDRVLFDLSKLSGPHTVAHSFSQPPSTLNTTYALDICKPLVPDGDNKDERCPGPTQVCAIERLINPIEKTNAISRVIPIAGAFDDEHPLDPVFNMLSAATAEDRLGFRAVLHGGSYAGRSQKAMIDFVCAPDMEGTEGEEKPQDGYKSSAAAAAKREEEKKEEEKEQKKALVFKSYGPDPMGAKDTDTLQVEWHTKYACATEASQASSHWGFFTWFIIIAFMSIAAYLIFGSWVNYNRYGARGWEALPHNDTIRDLPYLLKDFGRSVFSTVQSSGTRGGYSAV